MQGQVDCFPGFLSLYAAGDREGSKHNTSMLLAPVDSIHLGTSVSHKQSKQSKRRVSKKKNTDSIMQKL